MLKNIIQVSGLILLTIPCVLAQEPSADLIIQNGTIYTANEKQEVVSAIAIKDDQIIYVGDMEGVSDYQTDTTNVIDIQGGMALPGLHDVHIHPILALSKQTCVLEEGNTFNLEQVADLLKSCLSETSEQTLSEGDWITVANFNGYGADSAEFLGGFDTIADGLDTVTTTHKLFLIGTDGHVYAANHYALDNAATLNGKHYPVTSETLATDLSDYAQYFPATEEGEPTGLIKDAGAYDLFKYSKESVDSLLDRSDEINRYFMQAGVTSAQDVYSEQHEIEVYGTMAEQGDLKVRLTMAIPVTKDNHIDGDGNLNIDKFIGEVKMYRARFDSVENLKADAIKIMVDGVMEFPTVTAAMKKHYLDVNIETDGATEYILDRAACDTNATPCKGEEFNYGTLELQQTDLEKLLVAASTEDLVAHFHAIGDKAVDAALSAIEASRNAEVGSELPHNISHIQIIDSIDIDRFKGVYVTPTYAWFAPWHPYDTTVIPYIDEHQNVNNLDDLYDQDSYYMKNLYPVRSIMNAGGILAAGSDAPVDSASPRPFTNIMYGLLRSDWISDPNKAEEDLTDDDWSWITLNKDETLTIETLLDAYTINGARALRQNDITGSLEVGKKADIVIINQDIIAAAADASEDYPETAYSICEKGTSENCMTQVEYTIINGKIEYQSD